MVEGCDNCSRVLSGTYINVENIKRRVAIDAFLGETVTGVDTTSLNQIKFTFASGKSLTLNAVYYVYGLLTIEAKTEKNG